MYNPESTAPKLTPYDGEDFDVKILDGGNNEAETASASKVIIPKDWAEYNQRMDELLQKVRAGKKVLEVTEMTEQVEEVEAAGQETEELAADVAKVEPADPEMVDSEEKAAEGEEELSDEEKLAQLLKEQMTKDEPEEEKAAEGPKVTTFGNGVTFNNAHYEEVKRARVKMKEGDGGNRQGFDNDLWEQLKATEAELEKKNREIAKLKEKSARKNARRGILEAAAGWLNGRREKREAKKAAKSKEAEIQEAIRTDETLRSLYDTYARGWERYNRTRQSTAEQAQWLNTLASLKETILMEESKIAFEKRNLDGQKVDYKDAVMGFAKQMLTNGGVYTIIERELSQKEAGWDNGLGEAEKQLKMYEYEEEQYRKAAEIPDPEMMELIQSRLRNMFFASMRGKLMYDDAQKYGKAEAETAK